MTKEEEVSWCCYFMNIANLVSTKSKDKSTKAGAIIIGEGNIILSTGYNGFIRDMDDTLDELHERPEKYFWTEHAERNAIYNAARRGIKLLGSTAYTNVHPCIECARALVQAGIIEVNIPTKHADLFYRHGRWVDWEESFTNARRIFKAGHVRVMEHGV
ncbi:hypothetical protein LCGC14_2893930 [marine sediment metagenome]|uniref:CMP/dCMP-type deaminase domain-containing protein n=1 Tax=marine sediment metagenome TaxID=412755 RepID=A0A0F9A4C0_9ZZZZ